MTLRETNTRDPFATTYTVDPDRYPCPRHRADPEPPGSIWAVWTMCLWAVAAAGTLINVAVFGPVFNGIALIVVILYVAGIGTLLRGWRSLP